MVEEQLRDGRTGREAERLKEEQFIDSGKHCKHVTRKQTSRPDSGSDGRVSIARAVENALKLVTRKPNSRRKKEMGRDRK